MFNNEFTIEDLAGKLVDKYNKLKQAYDELRTVNENLKNNIWEKDEIARLKAENDKLTHMMCQGFPISDDEQEIIDTFKQKQIKRHPANVGAIGGRFEYKFVSTSVGDFGTIIDTVTGEKKDFTLFN